MQSEPGQEQKRRSVRCAGDRDVGGERRAALVEGGERGGTRLLDKAARERRMTGEWCVLLHHFDRLREAPPHSVRILLQKRGVALAAPTQIRQGAGMPTIALVDDDRNIL